MPDTSSDPYQVEAALADVQKRDVSEADTVTVINDMLADICGYNKYLHITSQYAIRGTYVDLAVKVDEDIRFLIEVKAVGFELKDAHVKQAIDYAANEGIEWVVLTNGVSWRIYKVHFGQPIDKILVCELDAMTTNVKNPEVIECFGNLSREGFSKGTMAELLLHKQVTSKFTVAAVLQTDVILEVLKREIRRMSPGVKIEVEYLRSVLQDEVLKRDLVDSDEAKAAQKRLQRAATRKKNAAREADEAPIVAKVEDAAASPPRAVAAQ
jgi:predicted type IV restriction endonuclease